jgi:hypothetical protein
MNAQEPPFIAVSRDPLGTQRWVVSMATPQHFVWCLFDDLEEARREAHDMACEGVEGGGDFAVWINTVSPALRASAIEATQDFVDAMIADAMARKECSNG